jgi:hypothetical protein
MLDSREAEQIWGELRDIKGAVSRCEALAATAANGVLELSAALGKEALARKTRDAQITKATADAIAQVLRDQLDRRAALAGSLASTITGLALYAIASILRR